ncbi:MAG: CoA transferase [Dehalococcoidia bacterium]
MAGAAAAALPHRAERTAGRKRGQPIPRPRGTRIKPEVLAAFAGQPRPSRKKSTDEPEVAPLVVPIPMSPTERILVVMDERYPCKLAAAMGICAALLHAQRTGKGQELHVSLLQSALDLQSDRVMREPVEDATLRDPFLAEIQQRRGAGAHYDQLLEVRHRQQSTRTAYKLFYSAYHTAKGALVLGAQTKRNRDAMRTILGLSDTTDSPDFDNAAPEAAGQLRRWRTDIQAALMARTAAEWVPIFLEAGAAATVVQFPEELADDPQVQAAGMTRDLTHEITGPQTVVGPFVRMSLTPTGSTRPAPALGFHSASVLEELGLSPAEIEALVGGGVVEMHADEATPRDVGNDPFRAEAMQEGRVDGLA